MNVSFTFGTTDADIRSQMKTGSTADLFHHHNHAANYLRRLRKDPHLGEPPPLPGDLQCSPEVFESEDDYKKGDEILSAMPAGDTPGQRTSVTKYNVATRMTS